MGGGPSHFWSVSTDIADARTPCVKALASTMHRYEPVNRNISFASMPDIIDLCFIDGDHRYDGVHHDVTKLRSRCRYIMLHDIVDPICAGVTRQWRELQAERKKSFQFECLQRPANSFNTVMGIGLIRVMSGEPE